MPVLAWPVRRPAPPARRAPGALDAARALVRGHLGPVLRAQGLRGSGSAWTLPCDTHWALVGVEQHADEWGTCVRLVPRLTVVSRAAWEAANVPRGRLPEVPPATVPSGVGWERRLSELVPGLPADAWWTVRATEEVPTLAAELLPALSRHGLPALRARLAAERAVRPGCATEGCDRAADVALRAPRRRVFLCREHGAQQRRELGWALVGRWPDLLGPTA